MPTERTDHETDDPHALTWPAWRGLLMLDMSHGDEQHAAADAGLVHRSFERFGAWVPTPKGRRHLAMAREAADGLTENEHALLTGKLGYLDDIASLYRRKLLERGPEGTRGQPTAFCRAALYLYERAATERSEGSDE